MKKTYYYLTIFCIILFIGQLLTGTNIQIAFLFSIAILFGLSAVFASNKWNSMLGLLNLALIVKFLLFGIIVKIIFLQPSDSPLLAPTQTATVTALGFAGVLIGTLINRAIPKPKAELIYTFPDKKFYLVLYLSLLILGYAAWLYVNVKRQSLNNIETGVGGVFGVLGQFGVLKELSVSAAVYYAWLSKSKRLISHPLVLFTLVLSSLIGIYSTSKQGILEPILYLFLTIVIIKGIRYKPLWVILITVALLYTNLIYPYSQYSRNVVRGYSSAAERITSISDILSKMVFDKEYLNSINKSIDIYESHKTEEQYLPVGGGSLGRLAMVSEADKLIAASTNSEQTGWKTISWGFNMILPRFINSDKPIFATNNYLAHLVGELGPRDFTTQVSYGFMANFYNAFGFIGVFFGSILLISSLYYWLSWFFGKQTNLNIWGILVIGEYHHPLTEQSVAGIIASIWFPVITLLVFMLSKIVTKIWLNKY